MRQFLRTHKQLVVGVLLWLVLFGFYSVTAWQQLSWPVFSSPDETANFAFAQQVRHTGVAAILTSLPGSPRSVINTGTQLVPGSFVFFPYLIGMVGKIFGTFGMLMFGPALAATAILAFWSLARDFIGRQGALFATLTLATFPTFWFYASRGLWQNGVFTNVLIISLWLTTRAWKVHTWSISLLAGFTWGVALAIRPSEISWVAPALVTFLLLSWKTVPWRHVGLACLAAVVPLLALLAFQQQSYGKLAAGGYRESAFEPAPIARSLSTFKQVKNVFFPFGTKPDIAWQRFTTYGIGPVAYVAIPGLLGFCWLLARRWRNRPQRAVLVSILVGSSLLVLLYGNFRFIEFPAVRTPVLDFSTLRYWLPLAVLESLGLGALLTAARHFATGRKVALVLGASFIAVSLTLIVLDNTIGMRSTTQRILRSQAQSQWIVNTTPAGSLIIAGSSDKLIFPRRHAIGYDGIIQPGMADFGDLPGRISVFALTSNVMQRNLVVQRYPTYVVGEPLLGPAGTVLFSLMLR
ncbi:MAG: glycosyltransferase family 39 protein [Patescibacteria group bacterium]